MRKFEAAGLDRGLWRVEADSHVLQVHEQLLPYLMTDPCSLFLSYFVPVLLPAVSYRFPFEEIALSRKRNVVIERHPALKEKKIERQTLQRLLTGSDRSEHAWVSEKKDEPPSEEILEWEKVGWGLQDYF